MQLLDTVQNQLLGVPETLQISLQDIVNQIQILSYYCVKHPDYKPLDLPESAVSHFQQLPLNIQTRHLSLLLRNLLYGIYYNGSLRTAQVPDKESTNLALNQVENNSLFGVDLAFYERLHTSNQSEGYWSNNWLVKKEELDGTLVVNKNGLTLHIQRDIHLPPQLQSATINDLVTIKMPKNLVQNAFYMAVANAATQRNQDIVRVYFNLTPEGAVAMMASLTSQLNAIQIAFSFKALYNPSDYGRYDSAVLYFNKNNYASVYPVLRKIYTEHKSHFYEPVPLFTKFIAPGLAIAEEPDDKFGSRESFGTHRCQIIANGLLNAWQEDNDTAAGRMKSILQQFSLHGIDLRCPYLNANSEDIYCQF